MITEADAEWSTDLFEAPTWVTIRARYADGTETTGKFIEDDIESAWIGDDDRVDDAWPVAWAPIAGRVTEL